MGQVEIRDTSLWIKHIKGDLSLTRLLEGTPAGEIVSLWIDGEKGEFERMKDAPNGPMPGFKPVGATRALWKKLYPARKGEMVAISSGLIPPNGGHPPNPAATWQEASTAERDAAWAAFKALSTAGWRSDTSAPLDRNELHER